MIVLHTHKPNYKPTAQVKVLGQVAGTTYLGTEDHKTAFALILSGHAKLTARNPGWAHYYARDIIRGRWPEAEAVIATNPRWAYHYALYVIKGRWPEAEAAIVTDPRYECRYELLTGIKLAKICVSRY